MQSFLEHYADKIVQVSDSGCMIWMGASTRSGYGIANSGSKSAAGNRVPAGAHRLSYQSEKGGIPAGKMVLHRCDVRCCVNPEHLFLGDQAVNMADMAQKKRSCLGAKHGLATMTDDVVRKIRSEYRFRKVTAQDLAQKYGLTRSAVAAVVRRQTWTHIPEGISP